MRFLNAANSMKPRYQQFNPKRRFLRLNDATMHRLHALAERVSYGGNPEHKRNPGDFGLTPPAGPRQGKSLCDTAEIFARAEALTLLKEGLRKGLVADREEHGWPKNIWAVTKAGIPLEAQLENPETGSYHGYPIPDSDPLAGEVIARWNNQHG